MSLEWLSEFERLEREATKECPSFPGYFADKHGNIWSVHSRWEKWRKLKGSLNSSGYLKIKALRGDKLITTTIHRMIADAWYGPKPIGLEIRRLDGSRTNNRPENLKYGTGAENAADRERHGRGTGKANGCKSAVKRRGRGVGAYWFPRDKLWVSNVSFKGKTKYIGRFKTKREAMEAYRATVKNLAELSADPALGKDGGEG